MGESWLGNWDVLLRWNELSSKSAPSTCLSHLLVFYNVSYYHFEQVLWLIFKAPLQQEPSCCPRHTRPTLLFQILAVYCLVLHYKTRSWTILTDPPRLFVCLMVTCNTSLPNTFLSLLLLSLSSFGGLFTVLLFFGQWFPRCSKVMIWTKNTYYTGFMDAYHAPFTPKHRYWVGLLLFALIVHNLVAAMAPDTSLPVLSSGCIAVGLISLTNRVHKKQLSDYLETFFLFNLGILSIGTSYVVETHQQQETLTNVSMSIAFILFYNNQLPFPPLYTKEHQNRTQDKGSR